MTGMFAGNDIYYPYASDGAVNIDGLLRRLEKDGYTGFCTMEPHTTPEKCLDFYREETAYLRERGIKAYTIYPAKMTEVIFAAFL